MKKKWHSRIIGILFISLILLSLTFRIILWDFFNYWSPFMDLTIAPGNAVSNFISDVKYFYWIYDEKWIIGKTPNEIIERYGYFVETSGKRDDQGNLLYSEDGILLCKSGAYYLVEREPKDDSALLHIYFDENYKAYKVEVKFGVKGG